MPSLARIEKQRARASVPQDASLFLEIVNDGRVHVPGVGLFDAAAHASHRDLHRDLGNVAELLLFMEAEARERGVRWRDREGPKVTFDQLSIYALHQRPMFGAEDAYSARVRYEVGRRMERLIHEYFVDVGYRILAKCQNCRRYFLSLKRDQSWCKDCQPSRQPAARTVRVRQHRARNT